jgi:hypothetical protein
MLFMLNSKARPGVNREQLVERLTQRLHPSTWDLIRHGTVSHVLYKVGDEPGFTAVIHAPSLEDAKELIAPSIAGEVLFDVEIIPVNQFPHFD